MSKGGGRGIGRERRWREKVGKEGSVCMKEREEAYEEGLAGGRIII